MRKALTTAVVKEALRAVLTEVQEASGNAVPELTDDLRPIGEAAGFDSLMGVEAAVMLEERLGVELRVEDVFASTEDLRARSIAEIADRIVGDVSEGAKP